MKRGTVLLIIICMLGITIPAMGAMSISKMRQNTRFLTDRMAYELRLSPQQYDDVYEVNYDFINNVRYLMDDVVRGYDYAIERYYDLLDIRNDDLRWILSSTQYRRFMTAEHFYRPIYANNNKWQFRIFTVYTNINFYYYGKPHHYTTYCGGHYRSHFNNVSYYKTHYHNRYRHEIYNGNYRIRHDRAVYDRHRHNDFHVAVRPPKKDHHHSVTPPARPNHHSARPNDHSARPNRPSTRPNDHSTRPNHPSVRPDRPSGNHRPATPQAKPDRPKKDRDYKHDGRPSRREHNTRVDKNRREDKSHAPSRRDVKRENNRRERDVDKSRGRDKENSGEKSGVRMRTV